MTPRMLKTKCVMIAVCATLTGPQVFAADDFCWKDSYGRGAGTIPSACAPGREKIGLLCYSTCPAGMRRFGFDCHSVCPSGMRDDGLFCRIAEYGRGTGYAWTLSDGVSQTGMIARCEADHGKGNCERNGLMYYPKCKPGYSAFACCICRPDAPKCTALGLNAGIDLSCAKKVSIGDPVPGVCSSGLQYDAGLCYAGCNAGYNGVGPVCWGTCPAAFPVTCGAGCATSQEACVRNTTDQVMSVLEAVANVGLAVGTAGASTGATAGAKAATTAAKTGSRFARNMTRAEISGIIRQKAKEQGKELAQNAIDTYADAVMQAGTTGEFDPSVLAGLDPTGVASVVVAYAKPVCYAPSPSAPSTPTRPPSMITLATSPTTQAGPAAPTQLSASFSTSPKPTIQPRIETPQPSMGTALAWVSSTTQPANAIIGGQDRGIPLFICRGMQQTGVHPGKVIENRCITSYGGKEVSHIHFELLTGDPSGLEWVPGPSSSGMVIAGQQLGQPLGICRANYQGGVHPGKFVAGQRNITYRSKEIVLPQFEVMRHK